MKCVQCGQRLRRVHRTVVERIGYMAVYACRTWKREEFAPRRFPYPFGPSWRCPLCGTYRVVRLKQPDKIDRMHGGFLNFLEHLAGRGRLFHCRWCRLQFYDRRGLATHADAGPPAEPVVPVAEKTAGSAP